MLSAPHAGKSALVIGAGLAGSLAAVFLSRLGFAVEVRERRPDPRAAGYLGGRSINLALSARGLAALREVGLEDEVMAKDAIRMPGRMIHPAGAGAAPVFQPYSADPKDAINSVSRGGLNLTLLRAAAAQPGVRLVFDSACTDVDLSRGVAFFAHTGGGASPPAPGAAPVHRTERAQADLIVCTDGAYSAARAAMMRQDRYEYAQTYLAHGYKELHIPPRAGPEPFALAPNALHIWPRGGSMMIALPNRDGSFTCTLFWPYEGDHSFASVGTDPAAVRAHFERHYQDALPLMPTLVEDYQRNPIGSLLTVRCWPWQAAGKVVLVGDSAHAIVPFYGQGMNAAFEDVSALARCLREQPADLPLALQRYQCERKPNADAIAEMALANFVEMRDTSGKPAFLERKKVERALQRLDPDRYLPQYDLVSFSTVPYTEARRRGDQIAALIDTLLPRLTPADLSGPEPALTQRVRSLLA